MNKDLQYEKSFAPGMWLIGLLTTTLLVVTAIMIGGYATGWGGKLHIAQTAVALSNNTGTANATLNLSIFTGQMMGAGSLGPAYVPSNFSVPADSVVKVTVLDFDTATPLTGALVKYSHVTGVIGNSMTIQKINPLTPNSPIGTARKVNYLSPSLVAHTLTIPQLGINVPMAGQSKIVFYIKTGKSGTYQWLCMDPCGGGTNGLGSPMGIEGYMAGHMTVN